MIARVLLAAALTVLFFGVSAHSESHETIKLKVAAHGFDPEVLVVENLPIGASETVVTDAGNEALVTRFDDRIEIELHGESIVVEIPHREELSFGVADAGGSIQHKVIVVDSDHDFEFHGDATHMDVAQILEALDLEGLGDLQGDDRKVMIIEREVHSEVHSDNQ